VALNSSDATQKILPRLPSVDDAYDVFNKIDTPRPTTPKATTSILPPLPPVTPNDRQPQESYSTTESSISTDSQASETPTVPAKDNSEQLLATLRHNFQKIEQSLYTQLAKTPETSLNDVRRSFIATGKGTQKRLKAWQKKHLGISNSKAVAELVVEEPEWWSKGSHAVPGGNIIVRENDWGSIIAHTLRYH
jgi:1-phosphatidylinositol-3-phosphate 5-kinase